MEKNDFKIGDEVEIVIDCPAILHLLGRKGKIVGRYNDEYWTIKIPNILKNFDFTIVARTEDFKKWESQN